MASNIYWIKNLGINELPFEEDAYITQHVAVDVKKTWEIDNCTIIVTLSDVPGWDGPFYYYNGYEKRFKGMSVEEFLRTMPNNIIKSVPDDVKEMLSL